VEREDKTEVMKGRWFVGSQSIQEIEGTAEQLIGHDGVGNTLEGSRRGCSDGQME
jgi:hypothetical protein